MAFSIQVMYHNVRLGVGRKNEVRKRTKCLCSYHATPLDVYDKIPSTPKASVDKSIWMATPARSIDVLMSLLRKCVPP